MLAADSIRQPCASSDIYSSVLASGLERDRIDRLLKYAAAMLRPPNLGAFRRSGVMLKLPLCPLASTEASHP